MVLARLLVAALLPLCVPALPQEGAAYNFRPITAPIEHLGVYHVATGTWTRGARLSNLLQLGPIYNNTCSPVYFATMQVGDLFQHRSRIPSDTGPVTDSLFYGVTNSDHRYDEQPGDAQSYEIVGFGVGYCSSSTTPVAFTNSFANCYIQCAAMDMVPQHVYPLTGLPGGTASGGQQCYSYDVDLGGSPMALSGDCDGMYSGPSSADSFGWSIQTPMTFPDTGPIIAGNFTWTGGPGTVSGLLQPCTGTDGTFWQPPSPNLLEPGTGMSSNDFFRNGNTAPSSPSGPGCYSFGGINGNPHSDFDLLLYANVSPPDPLVKFCAPGVGGIVTCPCGNPQVPAGSTSGCNNFVAPNGGAVLSGSGDPLTNPNDTLVFSYTGGVGTSLTVLLQGTTNTPNTRTGAGVRCVGGTLKRLYKGNPVAGSITFPNNGVQVHLQSIARGYTIVPPITLFYYAAYRNSAANGQIGCPGLTFGFNSSNAGAVSWAP